MCQQNQNSMITGVSKSFRENVCQGNRTHRSRRMVSSESINKRKDKNRKEQSIQIINICYSNRRIHCTAIRYENQHSREMLKRTNIHVIIVKLQIWNCKCMYISVRCQVCSTYYVLQQGYT